MCTALENLRIQGVEEGLEKGIEKGLEQGIKKEKMDIAKVSIKKGLAIDLIAEITCLTIEEIMYLRIMKSKRKILSDRDS
ncbi:MAG: hypothetical protein GX915_07795 [Clostridiales bacterium]|nr:hypothetical protein [Clostridiales bacterium]